MIFNDLWDGICQGEIVEGVDHATPTTSTKPIVDKEIVIWKSIDKKGYTLIVSLDNQEVSQQPNKISYGSLKNLKDLYD